MKNRYRRAWPLTLMAFLATQLPALAQIPPTTGTTCNAGLFTDLGTAISTIMSTFQLAEAGAQACSLAYMAMVVVAFAVIGVGIAGAIRAYKEDDISLFIKPFFLALAIAAVIVGSSNIFI